MKRLVTLSLGLLLLAAPAFAQAKAKSADKAAAPEAASAAGKVTAVTADSLTVKGKDAGMDVRGRQGRPRSSPRGAATRWRRMTADKKPAVITAFVSVGDDVDGEIPRHGRDQARRHRDRATPPPPLPRRRSSRLDRDRHIFWIGDPGILRDPASNPMRADNSLARRAFCRIMDVNLIGIPDVRTLHGTSATRAVLRPLRGQPARQHLD